MMTKNQINEREQLEMLTIEQLVPQDHLVRKLDAAIDFSFIPISRRSLLNHWETQHLPCCTDQDDIHSVYLRHPFHAPDNQGN
ncbi:hypothetical protein J2Z23_000709 [Lederbergia galactosidilyticus]|nr:hypothetical protein [Lederbergia galactosidilytica]